MKRPIIAISLDIQTNSDKYKYAESPWYALRADYSDSVSKSGGMPILVPFDHDSIDDVLDIADGILIPGGDVDIDPKFYGQEKKYDNVIINHTRTEFDLKFIEKILAKKIPFLGICYGMQLLNVYLGGTLIQHIPSDFKTDIKHQQPSPKNAPWHDVILENGSLLDGLAEGKSTWKVNSTHHQAVDMPGKDLTVSARATDGIIEAIEYTKHDFVLGVEWHPEYLENKLDEAIFKAFIDAARNYGKK
jgi:putative glutamine amidotransferase